jgi:hypothetical protein
MLRKRMSLGVLALAVCVVAGCANQPAPSSDAPGFLMGLGNGLIAPLALVVSLFREDVRMYAFPNSGVGYDFGFLLGIAVWGSGGAAAASGGRDDDDNEEIDRLRRKVRRLRRRLRGSS